MAGGAEDAFESDDGVAAQDVGSGADANTDVLQVSALVGSEDGVTNLIATVRLRRLDHVAGHVHRDTPGSSTGRPGAGPCEKMLGAGWFPAGWFSESSVMSRPRRSSTAAPIRPSFDHAAGAAPAK